MLEKEYVLPIKEKNMEVQCSLSNKKPEGLNDENWSSEAVFLKAEIFEIKNGKRVSFASPRITTIYGQTATIEMSDDKDKSTRLLKLNFNPNKI